MKTFAIAIALAALLSGAVAKEGEVGTLPAHSSWGSSAIGDFEFRITDIEMGFSLRNLERPPPVDRGDLASCANWFVHHWQHTKDIDALRNLLDSDDAFQTENPFERLRKKDRAAMARSYSHLIDFQGYLFLIGTVQDKENKKVRVLGTYRWDDNTNCFHAVLDTPGFRDVSGSEFRRALYMIDLNALSQNPSAQQKPQSSKPKSGNGAKPVILP